LDQLAGLADLKARRSNRIEARKGGAWIGIFPG